MRVLVIGAGAVGGYFGARLALAGRDVTFLVRERRAEQLRQRGLRVRLPEGELQVEPQLLTAAELRERPQTFELILLGTKAYSLQPAMEDFAPAVGDGTGILPVLNGMRHLDVLAERFGESAVLGGCSKISSDLSPEGDVILFPGFDELMYGELDGSISPRIRAVDSTLKEAGFPALFVPEIRKAMWTKWYLLSSLAAVTCLLRASVGAIEATRYGAETTLAINAECAAVAAANGYPQTAEFMAEHNARMTRAGSPLTASMFRDLSKGAPVEVEHTLGDFLERGEAHGVKMPLLKAAYVQLSAYERQRAAGR